MTNSKVIDLLDRQRTRSYPDPCSRIGRWVRGKYYGALAGYLERRLMVPVNPERLAHVLDSYRSPGGLHWTDDTWIMWIKNLLREWGVLEGTAREHPPDIQLFTELHTGFLYIWETPEELARLGWNEDPSPNRAAVARSKKASAVEVISPIDRVAARVTTGE